MEKLQIKAYHGTTMPKARDILKTGTFHESSKETEWLGTGVYFFVYQAHAERWADLEVRKKKHCGQLPAVLSADLLYSDAQAIDLDDPAQLRFFNCVVSEALSEASENIQANLELDKRKKWCFSCNLFRKIHKEIGITFYTFPNSFGEKESSRWFSENQRQICVSDQSIITDVHLV